MIYCDESGSTGMNFLDKNQPLFSYVSNDLTEEEAVELLKYFDTGQSKKETKFSKIMKINDIVKRFESFFNSEILRDDRVLISIYNKEFFLITKLVDTIIEPIFYENKIDLYKNRRNLMAALDIYNTLYDQNILQKDRDNFLFSLNQLFRYKNEESLNLFTINTSNIIKKTKEKFVQDILRSYINFPDGIIDNISEDNMFDPITSAIYYHINIWGQKNGLCNIEVKNDTKLLDIYIDYAKSLTHSSFEEYIECMKVNVGDHIKLIGNMPLKYLNLLPVKKYNLVNSKDFPQIQISDIIAGFVCFIYNKNNINHPLVKLSDRINLNIHPMIPEYYSNTSFVTDDSPNLVEELTKTYIQRKKS